MKLTKLEIKGFKSFGDKITILFDEGVTSIVGPNGCGKSNIVDAIRWVLGEQRTTILRSDKMENVIFNGTKNRKPLQMAEVSLSFDNTKNILSTDYSQVTVTRKYFRDGEGEYLLNGVSCRMKDITNLFLDTGIGPDSYAIIELKMVDDLLKDKDNARMQLFEEAAGISKFKIRKKMTFRKLESVDEDLKRVEDLLFEIEKNLKIYSKQAKQTEKYNRLKEELKNYTIEHTKFFLQDKSIKYQQLQKTLEETSDHQLQIQNKIQTLDAELEVKRKELIIKERELTQVQRELNSYISFIQQTENDKKVKNEKLKFLHDRENSLSQLINTDKTNLKDLSSRLSFLESEKIKEESAVFKLKSLVSTLKDSLEQENLIVVQLKEKLNEKNSELKNLQNQVFTGTKDIEIKKIQVESLKHELTKNENDSNVRSHELTEMDVALSKIQNIKTEKENEKTDLTSKVEENSFLVDQLEQEIVSIKDEISKLVRTIDSKENEYLLTKSMVDNLEGFPESIKFLKKNAPWTKEALLLNDVLNCEEEYKLAIENYLEPFLNYYVVDSREEAWQAINLLSDAAKGRAHFFLLDSLKEFQPQIIANFENALPALQVIETEEKYQKLINYLLDNVYIILKNQVEIIQNDSAVFLSIDGKFIKRNFSLSGGSVGLFEGKTIGRSKNIDKLQKDIKILRSAELKLKNKLDQAQNTLRQLKDNSLKDNLFKITLELERATQEFITLHTKCEQYHNFISDANVHKEQIVAEIERLELEIVRTKPSVDEEQLKLQNLESETTELLNQLNLENEVLTESSDNYNRDNLVYHQQINKLSTIENEFQFINRSIHEISSRVEKHLIEIKDVQFEMKEIIDKEIVGDDELIGYYQKKETMERNVGNVEKGYYSIRGEIEDSEKNLREFQRQKESDINLSTITNEEITQLKLSLSSLKERLSIEYNIDIDELMKETPDDKYTPEELEQSILKAKNYIANIGPVNPMALESYKEIEERYNFINGQKQDLIDAKTQLITTISEIEIAAKEEFMKAFTKIRENFIKVFRTLFSDEDKCDLVITDMANPLESEIEIIAKPKGKKPLSISQLSGGEKTLTATALLFAVYLLKPAPFCIFDEVDAPLDDNNIDKFNRIIREFSKDSQFIIVTHNKRTMENTDVIYGITMVEDGVSRVVPVDLREMAEN